MKRNLVRLASLCFTALLLSACAETRFGEPITRDDKGNLPRIETTSLTDAEADNFYQQLLNEPSPFVDEKESDESEDYSKLVAKRWNETLKKLKEEKVENNPDRLAQQRRIGRINHLIEKDKTDLRRQVLQLWLIQYGALEGKEAEKATEVLQTKIIEETDLSCIIHHVCLATLVVEKDKSGDFTDEHRAALVRLDKYYRTGDAEEVKENPPPTEMP